MARTVRDSCRALVLVSSPSVIGTWKVTSSDLVEVRGLDLLSFFLRPGADKALECTVVPSLDLHKVAG